MSRTLTEIYNEAVATRNKYLELTEYKNDSKMSVINAFTWVVSASIFSFEKMMDVFMLDIAKAFNGRINGTPAYYVNALLKWQYGDELVVNDEGTMFYYPTIDKTKRIISHVSYQDLASSELKDNVMVLKVSSGEGRGMTRLTDDELIAVRAYINKIKFAGVKCNVVSRKGDILVPKLTVYYDGSVSKEEMYDLIDESLTGFIDGMDFDSVIYAQRVIDVIQKTKHVTDVYVDPDAHVPQGVFIAQYDDNNTLGELKKIDRKCYTSSGYIKESTKADKEKDIPTFREALVLKLETE